MKDLQSISNAPLGSVPADVWMHVFALVYVESLLEAVKQGGTSFKMKQERRRAAVAAWDMANTAVEDLGALRKERG
jgi:hypothetical protein